MSSRHFQQPLTTHQTDPDSIATLKHQLIESDRENKEYWKIDWQMISSAARHKPILIPPSSREDGNV